MAFVWNPYAWPGIAVALVGIPLAILVYRAAPKQAANRRLAATQMLLALSVGAGFGLAYSFDDPRAVYVAEAANTTLFLLLVPMYVSFFGTLDTPFARPFEHRAGLALLGLFALAFEGLWFARPSLFIAAIAEAEPLAPYDLVPGSLFLAFQALTFIALPYGIVATVDAWRRAPQGTIARRRAKGLAIAFVSAATVLLAVLLVAFGARERGAASEGIVIGLGVPFANLLQIALLAYAILRTQLFDIDLKIKLGIQRGTLVAIFVVVAFVAFEIAQAYLSRAFGFAAGAAVTGVLLFLSPRLNKLAERVSDTALPKVQNTSAYLEYKKLEVYRGALEESLRHGPFTEKDRAILERLRSQLEIAAADASALEADVRRRPAADR